jgi:hypothetical protein
MAIAVNYSARSRYVVQSERSLPKEKRTVYIMKPRSLDGARAVARAFKDDTSVDAVIQQLRYTLAGWENLLGENGQPVQFKADQAGCATEESISMIPEKDREELAFSPEVVQGFSETDLGN